MIEERSDYTFFKIGIYIFIPMILFGFIFSYYIYPNYIYNNQDFICVFNKYVGLPCPGCGGTRAVVSLFHGKILRSLLYNISVLYFCVAYVQFMLLFIFRKYINKSISSKAIIVEKYAYGFIAVIFINWIVKLFIILKGV